MDKVWYTNFINSTVKSSTKRLYIIEIIVLDISIKLISKIEHKICYFYTKEVYMCNVKKNKNRVV